MAPASHDDIRRAQSQLVLLKSKLKQRRGPESDLAETRTANGRFERVNAIEPFSQGFNSGASVTGRSRAEAREVSPRGMAWDPPTHSARHCAELPEQVPPSFGGDAWRVTARASTPSAGNHGPCGGAAGGADMDHLNVGLGSSLPPEDDGGLLVPCPECGRSFKEASLEKHINICRKVFSQKRKQFNSAANRLGELENAQQLIANAKKIDKERNLKATRGDRDKGEIPEWKKKSLAFRSAVLAAKGAETGDSEAVAQANKLKAQLDAAGGADSGMTKCPHCGRTFNKEAGERHIAICLKTFGKKSGGGRLMRGAGQQASLAKHRENDTGLAAHARGSSANRTATAVPSAAQRQPSAHRRAAGPGSGLRHH